MTWTEVLAIYAAIISTAVAFVEVLRFVRDTRGKMVVDLFVYEEDMVDDDGNVTSRKIIRVNIVNHSASDRVITGPPWLSFDKEGSGRIALSQAGDFPPVGPFPKRLLPGDTCECLYDFRAIHSWAKRSSASKLRATVNDTFGKKHPSKWVKFSLD